jgi:alpha-beta hydrolase superfamily lysophospholipase
MTVSATMGRLGRIAQWIITVVSVLFLTIYFGWAFESRRMLQLQPEHRVELDSEFRARHEDETSWQGYVDIEAQLAAELDEKVHQGERPNSLVDRYSPGSLSYPDNFPSNWNRSYELSVPSPRGVAVLLHGLTDSPYSMLSTAQTLAGAGYNVVVPRIPGHGFAVSGLVQARWEDWTAAVRVAIRHAQTLPGQDKAFILGGYSNGALLSIDYALRCEEYEDMRCPDGLVLLSPAIAVSKAAIVTNLHPALSWLPYFEQFQWLSILPEIDPFKFTSFPKRAAWEVFRVSGRMHSELARPAEAAKLPPVLTFQSAVDNTVSAPAIVSLLYSKLPANGSQLVVYDLNRSSTALHLMKTRPPDLEEYFRSLDKLDYDVTIVRNTDDTRDIEILKLRAGDAGSTIAPTNLRWPQGVYSLSHIAIPFRTDDPVYGKKDKPDTLTLGSLAPRGEAGVLMLTSNYFLRMRSNPFYGLQARTLVEWLDSL